MKMMIITTTLRKNTESRTWNLSWTKHKPNWNYTTNPLQISKSSFFWNTDWTNLKTICGIETKILWSFLIGTNSSWEWTFTITTSTKNRICKSTIAKARTGKQWIVITTKSSWYWNRTWQYYSGIFWNHTFNIRKFTTTTSYMIWIFHSYTILYV